MAENHNRISNRRDMPGVSGKAVLAGMPSGTATYTAKRPGITKNAWMVCILSAVLVACLFFSGPAAAQSISILFLGDRGQHQPSERAQQLMSVMKTRGINITYTDNLDDLNAATLAKYDGLIIYADQDRIEPAQEEALLDFVAGGKGFIALHGASYCFLNSPEYVTLLGAQFKYHSVDRFSAPVVNAGHPVMKGIREFETLDETYVHTKLNPDCTVLQVRREGDRDEPLTWVRTHGKGRVFYTAYGHGDHTWDNPAFHSLIERGIRWACGSDTASSITR